MKLYATTFCALMLMGFGVLCNSDAKRGAVIDSSCDMEQVKLPPNWRQECVGPDKRLRPDAPAACAKILFNNRTLKKRCS